MRPLRDVATDFFSRFPESAPPSPHSRPRDPPPLLPSPPLTPPEPEPEPSALDDIAWLFSHAKARFQSRMGDLDRLIGEYTHMREMPDAEYALHMLRKIASCVKPIMRKRGWRVGTFSEFYPEQGNLLGLNVNHGQQILIRLRYPSNKRSFLPLEQALDTMLHELCHNKFGPHDHKFNALWNELRHEWEALSAKGFTGEGFLGNGHQLGGQRVPNDEIRRRARVAAQDRHNKLEKERRDRGRRLGGPGARPLPGAAGHGAAGGRRGVRRGDAGGGGLRDSGPIADATIRRTASVTDGCGTGTAAAEVAAEDAMLNGFRTKEDMDEADQMAIDQALFELMQMEEVDRLNEQDRDRERDRLRLQDQQRQQELQHRPGPRNPVPQTLHHGDDDVGLHGLQWDPVNGLQPAASPPRRPPSAPPSRSNPPSRSAPVPSRGPSVPASLPPLELNRFGRPVSRIVVEAEQQQQDEHHDPRRRRRSERPSPRRESSSSSRATSQPAPAQRELRPQLPTQQDGQQQARRASPWSCAVCTLINGSGAGRCGACETPRPAAPARAVAAPAPVQSRATAPAAAVSGGGAGNRLVRKERQAVAGAASAAGGSGAAGASAGAAAAGIYPLGWACGRCGAFMEHQWWTCSQCGLMKASS